MSKYDPLWKYISDINEFPLKLSFDDIKTVLGFDIDHSFLRYKAEAADYGFTVEKISLKEKTVIFDGLKRRLRS